LTALLASALPKAVEEAGAIAGFVSFALFLALLGLYILRALELRKLRRTMPFLVDPTEANGQPDESGAQRSSGNRG
jgi:hypothetical protein